MKSYSLFFFLVVLFFSCDDIFNRNFLLEIEVIPNDGGYVSVKNGYYKKGDVISLVAYENENYVFVGWSGDIETNQNPLEVKIDSDIKIKANFELIDNDSDGVADAIDTCPDTKKGSQVDDSGCCVDAKSVTFKDLKKIPYPSAYNSSASNGSFIYLSKGVRINNENIIERAPEVLRYDIINETWDTFLDNVNAVSYGASEIINSNLYLFNGKNYPIVDGKVLNESFEIVNIFSKTISRYITNPYPAVQSGSAVWNNNIIFFGGRNLDGCLDRVVRFSVETREFRIITNMPFPICNAKGEVYDNKLYIIGGDLDYDQSNKILIYDLNNDLWTDPFQLPFKISNHTTSIYRNKILIKGDFNILNLFAVFDVVDNKFSVIKSNVSDSRYLTSQVVNGEFYILGGNKSSNYSTMLDNFEVLNLEQEGYFCF